MSKATTRSTSRQVPNLEMPDGRASTSAAPNTAASRNNNSTSALAALLRPRETRDEEEARVLGELRSLLDTASDQLRAISAEVSTQTIIDSALDPIYEALDAREQRIIVRHCTGPQFLAELDLRAQLQASGRFDNSEDIDRIVQQWSLQQTQRQQQRRRNNNNRGRHSSNNGRKKSDQGGRKGDISGKGGPSGASA